MDLIAGATGFIGRHLAKLLLDSGQNCRLLTRHHQDIDNFYVADLADPLRLLGACSDIDRVFHCAGHAHAFSSLSDEDTKQHWLVNFEGTRNLAEAAGQAGVRRFVFLSSVKAMAEPVDTCADEDFPGQPITAYGQSKQAAEEAVLEAGARYGMHVVNLRLAMVYGSGGRGNLERMGRLVQKGWFPPLAETSNHRSLVHVDDVVAALCLVAEDDRASGRTYNVVGPQAPSGRELYDAMRKVLGLPPCRWTVPESALRLAAHCGNGLEKLFKRRFPLDSEALDRLLGSAWYSSARIERELGWRAKVTLEDGLREMFGR
ncbi:NAD-dependent epimerase/dehydratase family protein [uncultured Desulfobulbus sp.]|uniref:NAD-dependent epimerase/dehydratase family protein n=1 Tax=uncultured Desulfobulbus sp. TaxID=239745 RepID=UPI0029C9474C|nr:NAD-dependent epimerase/dehydratase family protein [uncultured Desulfobulbus sp.]